MLKQGSVGICRTKSTKICRSYSLLGNTTCMRTIIAGSREASWEQTIAAIDQCPWKAQISLVVSGTARGADAFGEVWAGMNNVPIKRYPADWNKHGKAAGFLRNKQMAENADALIAVWDGMSRGTKSMIQLAESGGLRVFVSYTQETGCVE